MTATQTHEIPQHPESQYGQTVQYIDGLLVDHGEIDDQPDSSTLRELRIDPTGNGYVLKDMRIFGRTNGSYGVLDGSYNAYDFDPMTQTATHIHTSPDLRRSDRRRLDDDGQRALVDKIRKAMEEGKIVPPYQPPQPGPLRRLGSTILRRHQNAKRIANGQE